MAGYLNKNVSIMVFKQEQASRKLIKNKLICDIQKKIISIIWYEININQFEGEMISFD